MQRTGQLRVRRFGVTVLVLAGVIYSGAGALTAVYGGTDRPGVTVADDKWDVVGPTGAGQAFLTR